MTFDLIVRDGTVVDGTGGPSFRSDIGIRDGKIAAFGRIRGGAARVIDAGGLVVAPGLIDAHTHMDAQVSWDPLGTSSCWHGITSVVMGNCGFSIAPCKPDYRERLIRALETVEAIPAEAMLAGIDWRWGSYRQYLQNLDRLPKGINFGGYIGHSALRPYVMGARAFSELASSADIEGMRNEVRDALQAGALGFATSRGKQHVTPEGKPVPSMIGDWSEVVAIAGVLEELNVGVLQMARDRTQLGFQRVRELALSSRVPIVYDTIPLEEDFRPWLRLTDEAATAGGRVVAQAHSRRITTVWGFHNQLPWDRHPVWKDLRRLPMGQQLEAIREERFRKRLVKAAYEVPDKGPIIRTQASIKGPEVFEDILVLRPGGGESPSIAQVARERGKDPVEVVLELSLEQNLRQLFMHPVSPDDPQGMLDILTHPRTVVTFSDAGAHASQISDFSLQTHFLSHWIRQRQIMSLERGIRKMTYDIATFWGMHDRGLLREGMAADLFIFDAAKVGPDTPEVSHDFPTGAARLTQKSVGVHFTIVNGEVLIENGRHTGALPGKVLRNRLASESATQTPGARLMPG